MYYADLFIGQPWIWLAVRQSRVRWGLTTPRRDALAMLCFWHFSERLKDDGNASAIAGRRVGE